MTEISTEAASKLIPDNYYNFLNYLLTDKTQMPDPGKSRVCTNKVMEEKILIMAQQILQHVCGVVTPLSVGTGYHLYNQTRSKDLITLNNRLGQSIGYDSLHRKLTAESASILQQIEEDGVYIPDSMTATADVLQVFAMDNLDWKNKTIEGGSFHATTAIAVENINLQEWPTSTNNPNITTSKDRRRTLTRVPMTVTPDCSLSALNKKKARSVENITSVTDLEVESDKSADKLLLFWFLARLRNADVQEPSLLYEDDDENTIPGFSAFCAQISERKPSSKIAYLPLIEHSPTNPSVSKKKCNV